MSHKHFHPALSFMFRRFGDLTISPYGCAAAAMWFLLLMMACGGGKSTESPAITSVLVSPASVNILQGGTQSFTATVSGNSNGAVTWTVQEPAGGTITSSGTYSAPAVAGTYHVVATSVGDPSKTGVAIVLIPDVVVSISPAAAKIGPNTGQAFTGTAVGSVNRAVKWSVQEGAGGGSITDTGIYTAPAAAGLYHVIATSIADGTKSAVAPVTVAPIVVTISPPSDVLGPLGVRDFIANLTASASAGAMWSVLEGALGGVITTAGGYTAPPFNLGMFHVIAASTADLSKTGTANVAVVPSGFRPTGNLQIARESQSATLLSDGRVLVVGGEAEVLGLCGPTGGSITEAELYDPANGAFSAAGQSLTARFSHTATVLNDGRVLLTGGSSSPTAELFDPSTKSFLATGSLLTARMAHTATRLQSGKVLITGGTATTATPAGTDLASAEVYDPASGSFTATGNMTVARSSHTAILLPNGKVLIAGGKGLQSTELYDPATGTFTPIANMIHVRARHTATLLPGNAKVLIAGGFDGTSPAESSAELYDVASSTFSAAVDMAVARHFHTATLLSSGQVLIAGGLNSSSVTTSELYDPAANTFTQTGSLGTARGAHTATLLLDGNTVLVTGGGRDSVPVATAELFR